LILGVGISLPGLVDSETGSVLFVPRFKRGDWAVAEEVSVATGLPVRVDKRAQSGGAGFLGLASREPDGFDGFASDSPFYNIGYRKSLTTIWRSDTFARSYNKASFTIFIRFF
jgi:hypothetical protein